MVSIRKYLNAVDRPRQGQADPAASGVIASLCAGILEHMAAYVLQGDQGSDFRAKLDDARERLSPAMSLEDALAVDETVRSSLSLWASRERESAQRTAMETQHVVGVLNHALMVLAGGSERAISRLQVIQESLNRTSAVRDMHGLRASLADAMKLIREESVREQEHSEREMAGFESQVLRFREQLAANPARKLPGRAGAIEAMTDRLAVLPPDTTLYLAAFVFDDIKAIVQRYGPEPAEELFYQVIRERIQPISATNASWRWSAGCVVSTFEHTSSLPVLKSELSKLCLLPLVYRMKLGSRTAVLKVAVSHLLATVSPRSLQSLVSQIDRFSGDIA